jgi:hypothetical protein
VVAVETAATTPSGEESGENSCGGASSSPVAPMAGLATGSPGLICGMVMVGERFSTGFIGSVGCGATLTPGAGCTGGIEVAGVKLGVGAGAALGLLVGALVGLLLGVLVGAGLAEAVGVALELGREVLVGLGLAVGRGDALGLAKGDGEAVGVADGAGAGAGVVLLVSVPVTETLTTMFASPMLEMFEFVTAARPTKLSDEFVT